MRNKKKASRLAATILGVALAVPSAPVFAAEFQQVIGIEFGTAAEAGGAYPNFVIVTLDGAIGSQPSCTSVANRISFDATSARGKNLLSMFQAAWLSGRRAKVTSFGGSTACALNSALLKWVNFN